MISADSDDSVSMNKGIRLAKLWFDIDIVELRVEVCDGSSLFVNHVYVGHDALDETVSSLDAFRTHVHGGLLNIRFGEFGPEYAKGAFHARFHFLQPGRLYITCKQESDFAEFARKKVASCATMFIESEPILLDHFITELKGLAEGNREHAMLEGV